jgi:hypothetical protein
VSTKWGRFILNSAIPLARPSRTNYSIDFISALIMRWNSPPSFAPVRLSDHCQLLYECPLIVF